MQRNYPLSGPTARRRHHQNHFDSSSNSQGGSAGPQVKVVSTSLLGQPLNNTSTFNPISQPLTTSCTAEVESSGSAAPKKSTPPPLPQLSSPISPLSPPYNSNNITSSWSRKNDLSEYGSSDSGFEYDYKDSSSYIGSSGWEPQNIVDMPCRERTTEFRTAAKSLQMKHQANGFAQKPKRKVVADSVQFNQIAKRIGRDLSQTCAKMEKLALLAKRKSLFNDRVGEIEDLTQSVRQDISGLNKQIATLQEFQRSHILSSPGFEAQRSSSGCPQGQNHSKSVVVGLQSRLAAVSTEFKSVLEVRTENLKQQKSRREKFSQSNPIPSSLPPSASSGNMGSVLLSDEYAASNGFVSLDMDNVENQRMHQQQVQLIDEQESYVNARASAMESIESSVVELGSIFKQLASLVSEQGETIQRIDANVEETSLNVEAGHMELLKYFRSISNNRWLAIKVFGVLIVFFIIFIIFLA